MGFGIGIGMGVAPSIMGGGMPVSVRANQPSLDLEFLLQRYGMNLQPKAFSDLITFTRASAATRINALGLVESVAANVPRVDHSPVNLTTGTGTQTVALEMDNTYAVTAVGGTVVVAGSGVGVGQMGAASGVITTPPGAGTVDVTFTTSGGLTALHVREVRGLLIEEQRTNYLPNSEGQTFGAGSNNNGLAVSLVGSGYIGSVKYSDIRIAGTATQNYLDVNLGFFEGSISASDITGSFYFGILSAALALPGGYRALRMYDTLSGWASQQIVDFNMTLIDASTPPARYSISKAARAGRAVAGINYSCSLVVGSAYDFTVRIGMAMIENGSFPTSYIPTSGSQVTRASDICSINTLSPWYNSAAGTIYAEASMPQLPPGSTFPQVSRLSGVAGETISIGFFTGISALEVMSGSVNQVAFYPPTAALLRKLAGAYALNSFGSSVNGSVPITDSSGVVPAVSVMWLGSTGSVLFLNGHIRKLRYFPRRLTDAQLQALTA